MVEKEEMIRKTVNCVNFIVFNLTRCFNDNFLTKMQYVQ